MYKFIAMTDELPDNGNISQFVKKLEDLGCVISGQHENIGVITGDSPVPLNELKVDGLLIDPDEEKKMVADPDSDIQ